MSYTPTYPIDVTVDESVKTFISEFYAISDDIARNEEWVDCFTPDAVLVMGDKSATGVDEIRALRNGMWENVRSRRHLLEEVYPDGAFDHGVALTIYGSAEFVLKSGVKETKVWTGCATLVHDGDRFRLASYQVYL